jgi:DNA invertase Pin-like site-specific DNA recombinase
VRVFGALAQAARALTLEHVQTGLAAAQRRGTRGGRPQAMRDDKLAAIRAALDGGASEAAMCRTCGVNRTTLDDALTRHPAEYTLPSRGYGVTSRAARPAHVAVIWRSSSTQRCPHCF